MKIPALILSAMLAFAIASHTIAKAEDPLPSWNESSAKQAILLVMPPWAEELESPKSASSREPDSYSFILIADPGARCFASGAVNKASPG